MRSLKLGAALIAVIVVPSAGCAAASSAPSTKPQPQRVSAQAAAPIVLWVNPKSGKDSAKGTSKGAALKTLTAAWNKIPQNKPLKRGYTIKILPGVLKTTAVPNYFEARRGTAKAQIIIESAGKPRSAKLPGVNIFNTHYLTLRNINFTSTLGDVVHCEQCSHFTMTGLIVRGAPRASGKVQEAVKVNQSSWVTITNSDISGASDNPLDLVAVQHATIRRNKIHDGTDWCAYAKGGSAYVRFDANELYDCGTGGFTAGQGTGAQFMQAPWLQYEAYDVKATNNVVHDVEGAAFGVNGGYNVLIANNTAYRTGSRDHLLEFVSGHRSCDGRPGDDGRANCQKWIDQGGWSTTRVDDGENYVRIPNKHVYVYNNVLINPPGVRSEYSHFVVGAPYSGAAQAGSNAPATVVFDDDLRIVGNVIRNGSTDLPLGVGGDEYGCRDGNATCNDAQIRRDNSINTSDVSVASTATWRLTGAPESVAIPAFPSEQLTLPIAGMVLDNSVRTDRTGAARTTGSSAGAHRS